MKIFVLICVWWSAIFQCLSAELRVDRAEDYDVILNKLKQDEFLIWSLIPVDEKWRNFKMEKLDGKRKKDVTSLLRDSVFSAAGGKYYWLEIPFERARQIGQGLLVLEFNDGTRFGYRYNSKMVDKKGLGFVDVESFNPKKGEVTWHSRSFINGVVLKKDIRLVLGGR